ncbi:hypothetical protein HDV03_003276 [Kappamyces sp. JEL0829]|nr:hypothetical protein HDV03_003276 [Kappamyces sp. JEL0829]
MFGFSLDWIENIPSKVSGPNGPLGWSPAVFNAYLDMYPNRSPTFNQSIFEWQAQEASAVGGILAMTMQPQDIASITDAQYNEMADYCLHINRDYGVPLFFRFAHEMNGDWPSYGMKPTEFIAAFRKLSTAIRSRTNMTAMVWGPNIGITYPFTTPNALSAAPTLATDPVNFRALDTNNDGVINNSDDPYGPYYPGDDYVDWVGMSLYWYPGYQTGYNVLPPSTYFYDQLRANGPTMDLVNAPRNGDPLLDFYERFVVQKGKPMMIPESSAPYTPNATNDGRNGNYDSAAIKSAWYGQILSDSTYKNLTRLKMVTQFEERKADGNGLVEDWRVLADPATLSSFKSLLSQQRSHVDFATDFRVDCGGNWKRK